MSLEDELMADFEDDLEEDFKVDEDEQGEQDEQNDNNTDIQIGEKKSSEKSENGNINGINKQVDQAVGGLNQQNKDLTTENILANLDLTGADLTTVSTLMKELDPVLERIQTDEPPKSLLGVNIENHPSYKLLVDANNYAVQIDNEVLIVHKFLTTLYSKRFSELEQLIPHPIDYAKVVKVMGNNINMDKEKLKSFLPSATVMVISMSALQEKNSRELTNYELDQVTKACDLLLKLDSAKSKITDYVSQRLSIFAPNITQIISSQTAAQILAFVGGLKGLSAMPNSNIPSLGAKNQIGIGFGLTGLQKHGFLYHTELVQQMPDKLRIKAMKIIAGKLVLAARMDAQHSSSDGSMGLEWRKEINEKLEKMVEAPEVVKTKALPVPTEKQGKRRGGRKFRRMRELYGETELQKARNRVGFGIQQGGSYGDDDDETVNINTFGSNNSIKISQGNRARLDKKNQARLDNIRAKQENIELPGQQVEIKNPEFNDTRNIKGKNTKPKSKWFAPSTNISTANNNKRKLESDESALNGDSKRQK